MLRMFWVVAVVGVFLPTYAVAQDVDPVGLYEWEANAGGEYVYGTFTIESGEEGLTGKAVSDDGESRISRIETSGSKVSFMVHSAAFGDVFVELTIDGERFTGFGVF